MANVGIWLAIFSLVCWGSWSNSMVIATKKYKSRMEHFLYDYSFGTFIFAVVAAFVGPQIDTVSAHQNFVNNLDSARGTRILLALAAGALFNLANLALLLGIDMVGMAIAFPLCIGTGLVVGTVLNYILEPIGRLELIIVGVCFGLMAVILNSFVYRMKEKEQAETSSENISDDISSPLVSKSKKNVHTGRAIIICVVGGFLMGLWSPLSAESMTGNGKLSAYTSFFFFTAAVCMTTFLYNAILMRFPIDGHSKPTRESEYLNANVSWHAHLWGLLGGIVWAAGTLSNLVASNRTGFAISYSLGQSAPMVSMLWGLLYWKEFAGVSSRIYKYLTFVFLMYGSAVACIAAAS